MIRRVVALLVGLTLAGLVPALASGVPVGSSTLDVYRSCVLTGVSSASTAVEDAQVDQQNPTSNFGTANSMSIEARNNQNRRVYVRFDLSLCSPAIPATATVVNAELDLFVTARAAVCRTIDVFPMSASWGEFTVTWNNQPVGTATNNPPTAQRTAFNTIGNNAACDYSATNIYASWSVTGDVAAWVAGRANYGWMLRDDAENSGPTRITTFATKNANNAARGPRLEITYLP